MSDDRDATAVEPPPPGSTIHLDARGLRVLAHPLRARLLATLRTGGPATATVLAGVLGTNTGATSYHLRRLAEVSLVEEVGDRAGRRRWWRAATESHAWNASAVAGDPDGQAAVEWLSAYYFDVFVRRYREWLAGQEPWPLEWRDAAGADDWVLSLTPRRLTALVAEVEAVVARYVVPDGEAAEPDEPDAVPVQVHLHRFPTSTAPR